MENFDQEENKRAFKRMIIVIGSVVLVAVAVTAFLIFRKESKETFDADKINSDLIAQETGPKELFSKDTSTWKNYYWSGKINTHYPSDWELKEKIAENGIISGLEIIPNTGNIEDTIYVGGDAVKCSGIAKYAKNKCLKNTIQVPFYTNSQNPEVQSAFDLIIQNTILVDIEK